MKNNKKEDLFASLLASKGLAFEREVGIRQYGVVRKRVDFYLPKYDLYCEVINRASIHNKTKIIRKLIEAGYKFTFYRPTGYKIVWEKWILDSLGLVSNTEIPFIPEFGTELRTVSGGIFDILLGPAPLSRFGKYR